jgi:hypothetical protein
MLSSSRLTARRISTCWFVAAIMTIAFSARARTQTLAGEAPRDSTKVALIRQLLDETHAVDLAVTAMETSLPAQRAANPRIPAVFWDRLLALVQARRDTLANLFVEIYDRHFSSAELQQMLAFYLSPVGRKLLGEQPAIVRESIIAGQAWGAQLGEEVGRQLAKEGVQVP